MIGADRYVRSTESPKYTVDGHDIFLDVLRTLGYFDKNVTGHGRTRPLPTACQILRQLDVSTLADDSFVADRVSNNL